MNEIEALTYERDLALEEVRRLNERVADLEYIEVLLRERLAHYKAELIAYERPERPQ